MSRRRTTILVGVLACLVALCLVANLPWPSSRSNNPPWITKENIMKTLITNNEIPLPGGGTVVAHENQIESVRIEQEGEQPGPSGGYDVSFDVRSDRGAYHVQGFVSPHNLEGTDYPIVNLGKGWYVTKK